MKSFKPNNLLIHNIHLFFTIPKLLLSSWKMMKAFAAGKSFFAISSLFWKKPASFHPIVSSWFWKPETIIQV